MANNFLNTNWVSMDILRLLLNKLEVAEYFNRSWERDFEKEFAPGAAITVKFPQRFLTSDGMGYAPQGINRISTTVSLDQWIQIAFEWDDYERAVKLERSEEELRENYLDPAGAAMAQEWDNRCANFAHLNTSQIAGILGTDPHLCGGLLRRSPAAEGDGLPSGQTLHAHQLLDDGVSGCEYHLDLQPQGRNQPHVERGLHWGPRWVRVLRVQLPVLSHRWDLGRFQHRGWCDPERDSDPDQRDCR